MICPCGGFMTCYDREVKQERDVLLWLRGQHDYQPLRVMSFKCQGCGRIHAKVFSQKTGKLLRTMN
jgi:hypothetical protein